MIVKICGLSHRQDIEMVDQMKPDYMGLVIDFPRSVRSVDSNDLPHLLAGVKSSVVYLFVNATMADILKVIALRKPFAVQLHGDESLEFVMALAENLNEVEIWKALHLPVDQDSLSIDHYLKKISAYTQAGSQKIILDSSVKGQYGGTGQTCDWDLAANIIERSDSHILLAGGLKSDNVAAAIKKVHPFGVDVSSGIEHTKSHKDPDQVQGFIQNAKNII